MRIVEKLKNDMENYEQYKTISPVEQVRLISNCVPTRFECQKNRKQNTTSRQEPQYLMYTPNMQPVPSPVQTEMPILEKFLTEDNCQSSLPDLPDSAQLPTLFCVCCLARDVPFVRLVTCCHTGFLYDMKLPEINLKMICHQCHNMLKKIEQFKLQVQESFKLLSYSSENTPKFTKQNSNYKIQQNFNIDIHDANLKNKIMRDKPQDPHTIGTKPNVRFDHIIQKEEIEDKDGTEMRLSPKSSLQKQKSARNIERALKIINKQHNQNNAGINLLTNSLQSISTTLLSGMLNPNIHLGSQYGTAFPTENNISGNKSLLSDMSASSTDNIVDIKAENGFETGLHSIAATSAISTENIADIKEENEFEAEPLNIAATSAISTENIADIKAENGFKTGLHSIAASSAISTENIADIKEENEFEAEPLNIAATSAISTENIADIKEENEFDACSTDMDTDLEYLNRMVKEENELNAESRNMATNTKTKMKEKISPNPSIHNYNEFTPTVPEEELINSNKGGSSILGDEIVGQIGKMIRDTYSMDKNVVKEELNKPVIEKEGSVDVDQSEKQESEGSGESKSVGSGLKHGAPIGLDKQPILVDYIKQVTLTFEQLMKEREKTAASPKYQRAPHKCSSCIIGFQFYENFEDHVKRKHTKTKHLKKCDICCQFVYYGASFETHLYWHHTRYQCVTCEKMFASYDNAVLHYKKQHNIDIKGAVLNCPRCLFKTGRKRLLIDHISSCSYCQECSKCGIKVGGETGVSLAVHEEYCKVTPSASKRAKLTLTATEKSLEDAVEFKKK